VCVLWCGSSSRGVPLAPPLRAILGSGFLDSEERATLTHCILAFSASMTCNWFAPVAGAQTRPSKKMPQPKQLKVLTYNVWVAPLVRLRPAVNLKRIAQLVAKMDPDVVIFQEVSRSSLEWTLEPRLSMAGPTGVRLEAWSRGEAV
jgi:hypothetical protein